ncbi:S8 family peptidase [Pedobacter sp. MC2016-05]|uniref:S8 family peptidase n=1 Tax=Pedobacter sp. MC2016-05 TaxID=2994474 RepID=UPI002246FEA0|nr:S8 family peptidase [Pedobacter sp. MC2016-05]MCX2476143.1 S8 family peptidase [Pedobacter sp. MC2016-05]
MNKSRIFRALLSAAVVSAVPFIANAQKANWQNLDLKTDSTFGISTEKAYKELLKGKKSTKVIVAVNDGGVENTHEDLKRIMWVNAKEISGNGKDDDKNGYADDIHGWNFIGGPKESVNFETLELTRLVRRDLKRFENTTDATVSAKDKADFEAFKARRADLEKQLGEAKAGLANISGFKNALDAFIKKLGKENPTLAEIKAYKPTAEMDGRIQSILVEQLANVSFKDFYEDQIKEGFDYYTRQAEYNLNVDYDPRSIVGDHPNDPKEKFYGNNDVAGPDAMHGSHVAGIIAADRTNNLGIKGVADNVVIMGVRVTPNGDERDKDVANGIRYAVDNGAKVINMSFGKAYSWDKAVVNEAMKYAASKDVLIVQAAGNENKDIDTENNFPNHKDLDEKTIASWITVGASGPKDDETLKASFSNFGKTQVDVFAPGVQIYSTVPGSKYKNLNGTSMASPVVAGLAGLIRSYYPKLTAAQVKEIIVKSVSKVNHNVSYKKGEEENAESVSVPFSDLCISGGIVNAYEALKLAATYNGKATAK